MQSEFIFPIDGAPTRQCHAATIAETPFGLVAAWFGGTEEKNADVNIWGAFNSGEGWSEPARIAWDEKYPCWNPVLFQPSDGPLMLFYKVGKNVRKWWGVVKTYEMGTGWSEPRKLGTDPKIGHLIGPAKNKPIQLADGSILCGSSTQHDGWKVHFERSADMGETWEVIGPIEGASAIQPAITSEKNPNGNEVWCLSVYCRGRRGGTCWTNAYDATPESGLTGWGRGLLEFSKFESVENLGEVMNSGIDMVDTDDSYGGRQWIAHNRPVKGHRKSRANLVVIWDWLDGNAPSSEWSDDNNNHMIHLERGEPGDEYSYPSMIVDADGLVHVVYTYNRQTIKHVVIDPEKQRCKCCMGS